MWRCYGESTLSADLRSYVGGEAYCSRHAKLRDLLSQCTGDSAELVNSDVTLSWVESAMKEGMDAAATAAPSSAAATTVSATVTASGAVSQAQPAAETASSSPH